MTKFDRDYAFDRVLSELRDARTNLDATILFLEREKAARDGPATSPERPRPQEPTTP